MRQQAGLTQHPSGDMLQVAEGRVEPELGQGLAGGGIAQLRLVAEGEQGLLAARRDAASGDLQDLVGGQVGPGHLPRRLGEGAVVANVAAELGQRDEHLARIGQDAAEGVLANRARAGGQPVERRLQQPQAQTGLLGGQDEGHAVSLSGTAARTRRSTAAL